MTMLQALKDVVRLAVGLGIKLDKEEEKLLGGPSGETISIWAAVSSRHGNAIAHVVCAMLWIVQVRHCWDQLHAVPMSAWDYAKAFLGLLAALPFVLVIAGGRKVWLLLTKN